MTELLESGELTTLDTVEETTIGSHPAIAAVTVRSDDGSDRKTTIGPRLAPDKALLMSTLPEEGWASRDAQGILNSIALSAEETATLPAYPPDPALIDVPETCIP